MAIETLHQSLERVEQRDKDLTAARQPDQVELSIIIPVYQEVENIEPLYQKLAQALEQLDRAWEVVFVDDGSRDGSLDVLRAVFQRDRRVRVISLRRNFGQTAAVSAGFDYAQGQVFITMDGDLQNDPNDIPRLLEKLNEGYDIVSGWRRDRKDPFFTKGLPSLISNKLASWLTGIALHDSGCTLKVYRRDVVEGIHLYGELHRYIPAVASSVGARVAEIEVSHHPRQHGKSKYGITRLVRGLVDLISLKLLLSYMTRPMQMFGALGLISILLGGVFGIATLLMKLLMSFDITGNPMLYLMVMAFIVGIQFISLGFLGEITIRTYHESQHKPIYVVKEVMGAGKPRS